MPKPEHEALIYRLNPTAQLWTPTLKPPPPDLLMKPLVPGEVRKSLDGAWIAIGGGPGSSPARIVRN